MMKAGGVCIALLLALHLGRTVSQEVNNPVLAMSQIWFRRGIFDGPRSHTLALLQAAYVNTSEALLEALRKDSCSVIVLTGI